jgi:hypothetical protein
VRGGGGALERRLDRAAPEPDPLGVGPQPARDRRLDVGLLAPGGAIDLVDALGEDGGEDVLLVAEVQVERAARGLRARDDVGDRGVAVATLLEDRPRGGEQRAPRRRRAIGFRLGGQIRRPPS